MEKSFRASPSLPSPFYWTVKSASTSLSRRTEKFIFISTLGELSVSEREEGGRKGDLEMDGEGDVSSVDPLLPSF